MKGLAESITNEQNALQRKLKSSANIERLKKLLNLGEIVRTAIRIANRYSEMKNIMHHARLENILKKLIVVYGPARLHLKHPPLARSMSVGIEAL